MESLSVVVDEAVAVEDEDDVIELVGVEAVLAGVVVPVDEGFLLFERIVILKIYDRALSNLSYYAQIVKLEINQQKQQKYPTKSFARLHEYPFSSDVFLSFSDTQDDFLIRQKTTTKITKRLYFSITK